MAQPCNDKNPLQRDGTSQQQRFLAALEPGYASLHEFDLRDWLRFALHYAKEINYFPEDNPEVPGGNWESFFTEESQLNDLVQKAKTLLTQVDETEPADLPPHLALFISFLTLMAGSQQRLNRFTGRHLNFYYKRVLGFKNLPAVPDKVHVIFELAKTLDHFILPAQTALDAGKDNSPKPKPLVFATEQELTVNAARIAALKSWYNTGTALRYADVTDSADGLGTPVKSPFPLWNAFGDEAWPVATVGFALASPVLRTKEGERRIRLVLTFKQPVAAFDLNLFTVFITGEKEWQDVAFDTGITNPEISTAGTGSQVTLHILVPAAAKAIAGYNPAIHQERYNTTSPVIRLQVRAEGAGYQLWQTLAAAELTAVTIKVSVQGMKDLRVENDQGPVDAAKPFLAFGSQPRVGSNLYIGAEEVFSKNWQDITLHIDWKNLPEDLENHYSAYRKNYVQQNLSRNNYDLTPENANLPAPQEKKTSDRGGGTLIKSQDNFTAFATFIKNGTWYPTAPENSRTPLFGAKISLNQAGVVPQGNTLFELKFLYFSLPAYQKAAIQKIVSPAGKATISPAWGGWKGIIPGTFGSGAAHDKFSAAAKDGFIRLTLERDFFHQVYPQLYAVAMTIQGALIPREPYTPTVSTLTLDYSATATLAFAEPGADASADLNNFTRREIQFYHETPFGQTEQHVFLNRQFTFLPDKRVLLLPAAPVVGDWYIGLAGAAPGSVVSLLFQVAEGSEDPDAPTFSDTVKLSWAILTGNKWLPLDNKTILADDTNNFLRAGIIRFLLPPEAQTQHTFLNENLVWLKVSLPPGLAIHSVGRFSAVHTQAVKAVFRDQQNSLHHLQSGVPPETIRKLLERLPQIRSVSQPAGSFGGRAPENEADFYRRVSERLRHKNRAVTIWDYEHLVLQQYPDIYKVKCLNHTNKTSEVAPGAVRLVVIPDMRQQVSFNPLQPKVSKNRLGEIRSYLRRLQGLHVDLDVENVTYQPVILDFKVQFYPGLDKNAYKTRLNTDLVQYLSPWAFNREADIFFGGILHKSILIRFIEELSYVDYLSDFRMYFPGSPGDPDVLEAPDSRSILVSAETHAIQTQLVPVCL